MPQKLRCLEIFVVTSADVARSIFPAGALNLDGTIATIERGYLTKLSELRVGRDVVYGEDQSFDALERISRLRGACERFGIQISEIDPSNYQW